MQEMKALFGKAASLVQQLLLEGTCISQGKHFLATRTATKF